MSGDKTSEKNDTDIASEFKSNDKWWEIYGESIPDIFREEIRALRFALLGLVIDISQHKNAQKESALYRRFTEVKVKIRSAFLSIIDIEPDFATIVSALKDRKSELEAILKQLSGSPKTDRE